MLSAVPFLLRVTCSNAYSQIFENDDTLFMWPWIAYASVQTYSSASVLRVSIDGLLQYPIPRLSHTSCFRWVSSARELRPRSVVVRAWEGTSTLADITMAWERLSRPAISMQLKGGLLHGIQEP